MCKISVIVPVYNGDRFLEDCINSIEDAIDNEYEIIIVDDGSLDDSISIARKCIKNNTRIKLIEKQNGGVSSARMAGIDMSTGTHILFVDVDDKLTNSVNRINESLLTDSDWIVFSKEAKNETVNAEETDICKAILNLGGEYQSCYMGTVWSKIYRADIIKKNRICFRKQLMHGEDMFFNLEYIKFCRNITFIKKCIYQYRIQVDSATNRYQPNLPQNEAYFNKLLVEYFSHEDFQMTEEINYISVKGILICIKKYFAHRNNKKSLFKRLAEFKFFITENNYLNCINKCRLKKFNVIDRCCIFLLRMNMYATLLIITRVVSYLKAMNNNKSISILKGI